MTENSKSEIAMQLAKEVVLISQKYAHEKKNAATKRQGEVRAAVTKFAEQAKNNEA